MSFLTSIGLGRGRAAAKTTQIAERAIVDDDLEARSKEAQRQLRHAATNAEQVIEALLSSRATQRTRKPV